MEIVSLLINFKKKIDKHEKILHDLLRDCTHSRLCETKASNFNSMAFKLTIKRRIIPAAVMTGRSVTAWVSTAAIT